MAFLGIDTGGGTIKAGVVSKGKVKERAVVSTRARGKKETVIGQISGVAEGLCGKNIKGIGVGVPSILDREKGIIYETPNIPSCKEIPLKRELEKKFGKRVTVNNDANCFTLGEALYGKGKKHCIVAGAVLGTGFGSGLVSNRKIYCGKNCGAGEFGRMFFGKSEAEDYCSGKFFKKFYGVKGEELHEKALEGNKDAKKIFGEFGGNVGKALSALANAFDPEAIVFGGSVSKSYPFFEESLIRELKKHTYKKSFSETELAVSENPDSGILGASALCSKNRFLK